MTVDCKERNVPSREEWAKKITEAWTACVLAVIKVGDMLIEAKGALRHGEWLPMVKRDLPFGERVAAMLMAIARDGRIRVAAPEGRLPNAYSILYHLTRLDDATFRAALSDGRICASMTRATAIALRYQEPAPLPASLDPRGRYYTSAGNVFAGCTKQQLVAELARRPAMDRLLASLIERMPETGTVGAYVDPEEFQRMLEAAREAGE